jgi:hypothetical protein
VTSTDEVTFTLNNLSGLTTTNGVYKLTLNASTAGITNLLGKPLTAGATETWTKISPPPLPKTPTDVSASAFSATSVLVSWTDNNTVEDEYTIQRSTDETFAGNVKTIHSAGQHHVVPDRRP